jgi:hypothetical protein
MILSAATRALLRAAGRGGSSSARTLAVRRTITSSASVLPSTTLCAGGARRFKSAEPLTLGNDFPAASTTSEAPGGLFEDRPFNKIMAANRGEIATRIMRACAELGVPSVGIYSHEGRMIQAIHDSKTTYVFTCMMHSYVLTASNPLTHVNHVPNFR